MNQYYEPMKWKCKIEMSYVSKELIIENQYKEQM